MSCSVVCAQKAVMELECVITLGGYKWNFLAVASTYWWRLDAPKFRAKCKGIFSLFTYVQAFAKCISMMNIFDLWMNNLSTFPLHHNVKPNKCNLGCQQCCFLDGSVSALCQMRYSLIRFLSTIFTQLGKLIFCDKISKIWLENELIRFIRNVGQNTESEFSGLWMSEFAVSVLLSGLPRTISDLSLTISVPYIFVFLPLA